jgi:hypothetical protein
MQSDVSFDDSESDVVDGDDVLSSSVGDLSEREKKKR